MATRVTAVLLGLLGLGAYASGALTEDPVARVTLSSDVAQGESRVCGRCHSSEFSLWLSHPHSRFLFDASKEPRRVLGRWGADVPGWGEHVDGRFARQDIVLAYGVLQIQVYYRKDHDGHRLLPAQWNIREKRWEPLSQNLERLREERVTWEVRCAGCHTTGFNAEKGTFAERSVGCQACHGEGEQHRASGGRGPILRPSDLSPRARSEICGQCHARGKDRKTARPYPVGWSPGSSLEEAFRLEAPSPGRPDELFWPDGTERQTFMELQGFLQSRHFRAGLACSTCHLPHGSDYPYNLRHKTVELCVSCHKAARQENPVHREHPKGGADCADCHMAIANPSSGDARIRTHTLRFLEPSRSVATGMPNSCTVECHRDRNSLWAVSVLRRWRSK